MSLAAWMPSSLRFFSICLLRARAARSSADEAQPMAMARTAWLATRGSAVPLACSRPVVARTGRRARAHSRTRASQIQLNADAAMRLTTLSYHNIDYHLKGTRGRNLAARCERDPAGCDSATCIRLRMTVAQAYHAPTLRMSANRPRLLHPISPDTNYTLPYVSLRDKPPLDIFRHSLSLYTVKKC